MGTIVDYDILDSCIVDCSVDFDVFSQRKEVKSEPKQSEVLIKVPLNEVIVQIIEM